MKNTISDTGHHADADRLRGFDRRLLSFSDRKEGCEGKKSRRSATLKTPFLRCTGESCGKILFSEVQLEQAKKSSPVNSGIPQHEIENYARILLAGYSRLLREEKGNGICRMEGGADGAKTDKDSNGENVA